MFPPSPPSLAADNNACPWCLAHLAIQWCKSGPNKDKAYLICEDVDLHPERKPFWHWWGVLASRQARALLSASPSPTLNRTSSFSFASTSASAFPLPSSSSAAATMTTTQPTLMRCRYVGGCNSSRVAPACKSRCCKQHCIILNNGSCPVKTHDPATMSQRQRCAANVPLPAHRRTVFSPPPVASRRKSPVSGLTPSFLGALDELAQQQSFGWDYGPALQQARIDSPGVYLDQALRTGQGPPSSPSHPSLQDAADREDEELQLALTLSLAPSSSACPLTPLHPRTAASSPSLSQAPPPSQPRAPASSVARKTTLPKPPRITMQLNPAWMSQATGTRPANDTFAIRQPSARRATVDLATVQRFTLVYWDTDGKPPLILGVTECPSWPEFCLLESTRTLDLLDRDFTHLEYYNVRFCLWTRVDLTFTHILTSDTYLLLRHVGVSGLDEDRLIDHFVHLPGPQHIRYNLTAERAAVRHKIKSRQAQDADVEVVRVNGIKIEPIDGPCQSPISNADADDDDVEVVHRPTLRTDRPSLRIITGAAVTNPICVDDDETPSTATSSSPLFSALPALSPSTTPPASLFLWPSTNLDDARPSPSATSRALPKWPAGMYAVEMAEGFLRMEAPDMQHIPIAERFQQVFKTSAEFKQRTYTDARLRWTRGSESLRTAALDAGQTKAGLWSVYATNVPLKK